MAKKRRQFSPEFKGRIVVEVLKEEKDINTIATEHDLNPNLIRKWRQEFLDHPERVFDEDRRKKDSKLKETEIRDQREEMLKTIGALTLERDYLQQVCLKLGEGQQPPTYRS
jgi:transposase-like protein